MSVRAMQLHAQKFAGKYRQMVADGDASGDLSDADFTHAFARCVKPARLVDYPAIRGEVLADPELWARCLAANAKGGR